MSLRLLPQLLPRRYILSFRTVYPHGRTLRLHRPNSVDSGDKSPVLGTLLSKLPTKRSIIVSLTSLELGADAIPAM